MDLVTEVFALLVSSLDRVVQFVARSQVSATVSHSLIVHVVALPILLLNGRKNVDSPMLSA
jgi:hypothetical protein